MANVYFGLKLALRLLLIAGSEIILTINLHTLSGLSLILGSEKYFINTGWSVLFLFCFRKSRV